MKKKEPSGLKSTLLLLFFSVPTVYIFIFVNDACYSWVNNQKEQSAASSHSSSPSRIFSCLLFSLPSSIIHPFIRFCCNLQTSIAPHTSHTPFLPTYPPHEWGKTKQAWVPPVISPPSVNSGAFFLLLLPPPFIPAFPPFPPPAAPSPGHWARFKM